MRRLFPAYLLLLLCISVCSCDSWSDPAANGSPDSTVTDPQESSDDTATSGESEEDDSESLDLSTHTHNYTLSENTATCTQKGTALYTCSCGEAYVQASSELEHSYQNTSTIPTCTSSGRTRSVCSVCGEKKTTITPAGGHTYGAWYITKEATMTSDGIRTQTCMLCGNMKTETYEYDNAAYLNAMFDFTILSDNTCAISAKNCRAETIVIPSRAPSGHTVTAVADFQDVTAKHIILPDTIETVYDGAFKNCTALTELSLPDSCTSIGERAFYACKKLVRVDFGGVKTIGDYAFAHCTELKEIVLPDGLLSIGFCSFLNCTAAEKLYLGKSLTFLDEQAFESCTGIKTVYLPESLLLMRPESSSPVSPFYNCETICYTSASSMSDIHYSYFGSVVYGYTYEEYLALVES